MKSTPISVYPKIKIFVEMSASGSVAKSLGVEPKDKVACVSLEAQDVGEMMSALGWGNPAPGESSMAMASYEELMLHAIDQSSHLSGYGYSKLSVPFKQALDQQAPGWCESVDEGKSPQKAEVWVWARSSLETRDLCSARRAGPLLLATHEQASMDMVATLSENFERLGAQPQVSWEDGFCADPKGKSKLPPWGWKMSAGAAYCLEAESTEIACAWLSSKAIASLAKSPLGKAFSSWHVFGLISSIKPMRLVCGKYGSNKSYSSYALKGEMKKTLFPCQIAQASWADRGQKGASIEECEAALESVFGKEAKISRVSKNEERLGAMRPSGVEDWLESIQAQVTVRAIEKTLKKEKASTMKATKRSTRI